MGIGHYAPELTIWSSFLILFTSSSLLLLLLLLLSTDHCFTICGSIWITSCSTIYLTLKDLSSLYDLPTLLWQYLVPPQIFHTLIIHKIPGYVTQYVDSVFTLIRAFHISRIYRQHYHRAMDLQEARSTPRSCWPSNYSWWTRRILGFCLGKWNCQRTSGKIYRLQKLESTTIRYSATYRGVDHTGEPTGLGTSCYKISQCIKRSWHAM